MELLTHCLACNSTNSHSYLQVPAMMHERLPEKYNFNLCNDCGLVFLNPPVPENELSEFYSPNYLPYRIEDAWGKYARIVKQDQLNIDRARVKRLKEHYKLTNKSRILDVGCGRPTFLACLRNQTTASLIGLDFSDEGWKSKLETYHDIDLRIGEVADLQGEKPVDVITMWHYLEHDYRPRLHLQQLLDITHPQTKLIIEVPNFDSYTRRKFGQHWAGYHTPRHTAIYSPGNLELLIKNSGWQVEKVLTYGTLNPYTLHWMSRMEMKCIDWSGSMEKRFVDFVAGKALTAPIYMLQKWFSMGIMTIVARPS